ncbi:hypothetical protein K493DRAFT_319587 [Basidiobolus meristosporus CBS 931.73]|uniref:Uncharacterized protein n=1 Tax=Basidiobolus meristosporus CBS 931.73 TaxID=1314790 RepID=A0A1Y1XQC1_9FUNG|nr:hypothetical protein K493DRAFT_319587 [Basidiobolus meristosporus CBS 931.73]|eukprot:ORX87942.1 hypothetical protein K493DRAFT_319587 [Basidiobolus meristosporus CBS 931.73]
MELLNVTFQLHVLTPYPPYLWPSFKDIQAGLRRQFHYLASSGIATTNLPYRRSVYGEEKEFSSWAQVVTVLRKEMQTLLQELDVNVVDTDRPSH